MSSRRPADSQDAEESPYEEVPPALDNATDIHRSNSQSALAPSHSTDFSVYSHPLDERQAATLYVQSLPVLTFVGPELESLSGDKGLAAGEPGAIAAASSPPGTAAPNVRARQVGETLEQFQQEDGNPADIVARWDADQEEYLVALGETVLVSIDRHTMLPDTTQEPATDALHVANRLRRLMGGADPLTEVMGRPEPTPQLAVRSATTGMASWYGPGFHGRRSASGEVFNQNALTAAHRTLPFGTQVRVTNLHTQQQVVVRINDRGPFSHNRVIDLSARAARAIGLHRSGVGPVRVEVLATP